MKSILSEWKELLTNKKILIPVIAVLLIPLLYSGMFLWAFWDPYEKLDELPVAVVNLDQGAEYDGKALTIGEDLQGNLKKNDGFKWEFVSKDVAYEGLDKQHYYMVIEIPNDFSERATTLLDDNPSALEMKFVPNESYNFLSAQIGSTAVEKIKEEVSKELTGTYAEAMFTNLETMADGYKQAADGTGKLNSGVHELKDGSEALRKGLEQAAEKSIVFHNGVEKAYDGVKDIHQGNKDLSTGLGLLVDGQGKLSTASEKLQAGAGALNDGLTQSNEGMSQLVQAQEELTNGAGALAEGAAKLSDGTSNLEQGALQAQKKAGELNQGIVELKKALEPMIGQANEEQQAQINAYFEQLINGSGEFSQGLAALEQGATDLNAGASSLEQNGRKLADGQRSFQSGLAKMADGSKQLASGSSELLSGQTEFNQGLTEFGVKLNDARDGSTKIAEGSGQLLAGMEQLDGGSKQFQQGTKELADGSGKISSGLSDVGKGTEELEGKLKDASEKSGSIKGTEKTYDMISEPVKVKSEVENGVPNYGTGFAPYFLSLGLFVGALLLSIVYPMREPASIPRSGTAWFIGKVAVLAVVGILQALLADAVLILGLGVEVKSLTLFILFSIITSFTFIALVQFLVTTLGDPGRFVAILILILQLTTSAGTFPLELIPNALQPFNMLLPMTYSVSGFKAVISSGDIGFMWENVWILSGFMMAMLAGTWAYFMYKYRKNYNNNSQIESTPSNG
ncbi:YhgE/Pip domain-containing protein [Sutcliffiella horikoshii]|uniref:YhgE/Pip domain-containing protein n=1 Tax=Sutcliffiella horikoshii TaxID=79883 RepID=UPI0020424704|nr:YhgE/Pip domain-containing protein [Sutcliffiella horikoshii]MCM3616965.1 YhgE/Pip domain-containing protein [Sutcliffiella horikoshii]